MGMNRSLDLPDKTLQFIRDRPLMDEAARPLTGGPLLVKRGALLTRIVVDSVLALDGRRHAVMFIGTGLAASARYAVLRCVPGFLTALLFASVRKRLRSEGRQLRWGDVRHRGDSGV